MGHAVLVGELVRKIWNARNFKSHVSPHEFLQAVTNASKKKFKITEQVRRTSCFHWLTAGSLGDETKTRFLFAVILHVVAGRVCVIGSRAILFLSCLGF